MVLLTEVPLVLERLIKMCFCLVGFRYKLRDLYVWKVGQHRGRCENERRNETICGSDRFGTTHSLSRSRDTTNKTSTSQLIHGRCTCAGWQIGEISCPVFYKTSEVHKLGNLDVTALR